MASTGLKDKFGKLINVGHVIVYPVRRGSSMYLNHATVTGVDGTALLGTTDLNVKVKIKALNRCAIVEK